MARTRHSSSSPATTGRGGRPALSVVQGGAWRLLVLAEIANFGMLRRHVGRTRADLLVNDAVERARRALAAAAPQVVSRSSFELELLGTAREELEAHCDLLQAAFAQPFDLDGEHHHLELLLAGVASPVGGVEDVRLVEEVEDALAQARLEHRRVLRHLTQGRRAIDRIAIRRELPEALGAGQVFLQYQPKVHIRRQEIVSAEALVRWNHPTRGLILPSDFIPLAEQTQMIGPLTVWTLERVIADQRQLAADGHDLPVFINISGQLLGDTRFIDTACRMIAQSGARIGFEITETAMIRDPDSAIVHLKRIADVGVPIAIDDYGAGLSSLAYLKRLPATELKIDKMFVMELTSSNRDPLIVRSTIDLAHAMEMEVTAEGVETPAALALLSVMGCDMVQGFLISRPISIDAFRHYLHEQAGQPIELTGPGIKRPASFWKSA